MNGIDGRRPFLPNKRMNKMSVFFKLSSVLGILMIMISFAMAGCGNSPQSAQAQIDRMAKDMKADLPKMLDKDTKLINVYTGKLELVSEFELVNYEINEENKTAVEAKIKSYLKLQVCPSIKKQLLDQGVSARYLYKDKKDQTVVDQVLTKNDC